MVLIICVPNGSGLSANQHLMAWVRATEEGVVTTGHACGSVMKCFFSTAAEVIGDGSAAVAEPLRRASRLRMRPTHPVLREFRRFELTRLISGGGKNAVLFVYGKLPYNSLRRIRLCPPLLLLPVLKPESVLICI